MSQFTVRGRFRSRDGYRTFNKEIEAENENVAREYALSRFGSEHGLKRMQIELDEVSER
ncbi:50S ribosomal protein L18Ae [Haloprofundus salinisoli]|uniref:50S ribosomal protein L18Ae n=1 Tax=Haloprofundus salinisoli TaxID=2876193 RepID=UPI001CCE879F|nr:50S ribosomal protein L18Ae [Haloprofundus salinisoli]